MGILQADMKSASLSRVVRFSVVLPLDEEAQPLKQYPTLYLLHGIFGNSFSWLANSNIRRYAEKARVAVVMPEGENGFYLDHPAAMNRYSAWVGDELVRLTRQMLPLSPRREDTWIGGLSMGGYGALVNGLRYADTFSHIVALSAGLLLEGYAAGDRLPGPADAQGYMQAMFGDPATVLESDKNPLWLAERRLREGKPLPRICLSCGEQDFLLQANVQAAEKLRRMGADLTWRTSPGGHEWDFWDREIRWALENWLPGPKQEGEEGLAH